MKKLKKEPVIMKYIIRTEPLMRGPDVIGFGETEEKAWLNAFGPKPWHPIREKSSKGCWCEEIKPDMEITSYTL
jgi:hypothetical protein